MFNARVRDVHIMHVYVTFRVHVLCVCVYMGV